jgi:3'(2'), 5'-bisphosphate nucleotidase
LDSDFSTPDDESFLASIDRGVKSPQPNQRVWILDPIDGTKGLVTGKQYIVGLALTNPFGKTMVAVMGNPGVTPQVMVAVKGHGLRYWNAETGEACIELERKIPNNWHLNRYDFTKLLPLTESSNLGWGSDKSSVGVPGVDYPPFLLSRPMSVGSPLPFGPLSPPSEICCGAQVKYFAVARGDVAGFIQFQQDQLKSWDHAPGVLCVQESGGIAQDADGNEILFDGREFKVRKGIVCCAAETDTMTRQRFIECVEQTDITTV